MVRDQEQTQVHAVKIKQHKNWTCMQTPYKSDIAGEVSIKASQMLVCKSEKLKLILLI